jgi:hypothetical protein
MLKEICELQWKIWRASLEADVLRNPTLRQARDSQLVAGFGAGPSFP